MKRMKSVKQSILFIHNHNSAVVKGTAVAMETTVAMEITVAIAAFVAMVSSLL